jgi:hypothetical protein
MASKPKKRPAKMPRSAFADPVVGTAFSSYPKVLRAKLLALRRLILETASTTPGVGTLEETLKWGQPSYLTTETKSGSTIRIGEVKAGTDQYAMYVNCQTDLVATFREIYPTELTYGGNRSVVFNANDAVPEEALRHCVALALTYHLNKRKSPR